MIVVIRAMVGGNYSLPTPVDEIDGVRHILITKTEQSVEGWECLIATHFSLHSKPERRNAKIYKILPELFFPDCTHSIWIDSGYAIGCDPQEYVKQFSGDFAVHKHPNRSCLYVEGEAVKQKNKDSHNLVDAQMAHYKERKHPKNAGLYACGVIVRRHSPAVLQLDLAWWEQICRFSSRDQLSLPFAMRQLNKEVAIIPGNIFKLRQ